MPPDAPKNMPLTNLTIKNTKATGKTQRLFDGRGLYLEVSPTGNRWWRMKYRIYGKEKRLALGVYPEITLKEARFKCDDARKMLAEGIDPAAQKKAKRDAQKELAENSFEKTARAWFEVKKAQWVPSHADRILRRLERDIFPWLGSTPIATITPPTLLKVIRRIEKRGANETAHRALADCGQIFRFAIAEGNTERDITQDLRGALQPVRKNHFSAITDPKNAGPLLRKLHSYEGTFIVQSALRLAPYVFVRPGELRRAKWADMDLENAEWRYHVTKTDSDHVVPLATQAVSILQELYPLTGRSEFVFPSARSRRRPMSDNALLAAMRNMEISKEEMTTHGFRAMARTILDEVLGFRPDVIEHQFAHAVKDPNGRAYNRTAHLDARKTMMQVWADYLDKLREET